MNSYDVIIVGAGLSGCAVATALSQADPQHRRRILVIDRARDVHPRFSGEFIHPRGAQILDDLGLYQPLRLAGGIDVDGFAVYETADNQYVDLAYRNVPNERPAGLAVHHKVLVRTLRQTLRRLPNVELREGCFITGLVRNQGGAVSGATIEAQGVREQLSCDLLIAADGKRSTVRKLAGISDHGRQTLGFTAGLELVNASLPRPSYAHVLLGAWGPVLAYPILHRPDGTVSTRITFDLPSQLPAKGSKIREHLLRAYLPFLPSALGTEVAAALMSRNSPVQMAPTVNLPAPAATAPGVALVGDAAGCSHPITASGMTMGLRDAEALGNQALRRAKAPEHQAWIDGASLRRYRTEHDRYVPTRQALADAIHEAFRGENEGARAIRRALFEYWGSGERARQRSMALLSCSEGRPGVFLSEYLRTAGHAVGASLRPQHAWSYPVSDRLRKARGAAQMARDKLGLVAAVVWAQVRPPWLSAALGR